MHFASDNTGPAHPAVMDALLAANAGYAAPYGHDAGMQEVRARIREVFEAPHAAVYLVATGTAANALILATDSQPWQTIFCHRHSHIQEDECGAPEFYTSGAKLTLVEGAHGKMTPETLGAAIAGEGVREVHGVQRGPVSLTQVTERGTLYTPDEIAALGAIAKAHGLPVHMDGARFANALVALGCTPAQMTWRAGIDTLSFGGTKNGLLGVEAVVMFDPDKSWEFELRRKRAAQLFSKHRFLTAQMQAYLADDLWLTMARAANAACAHLVSGLRKIPDVRILHETPANMIFAELPHATYHRLKAGGAQISPRGEGPDHMLVRLVTDWSASRADTERFLALARG